jgi:carbon-monoxide dehydrogenase medium subunit
MQTFAYQRATTVAQAVKSASAPETRIIAGGQSLLSSMRLGLAAPDALVDLADIAELRGITLQKGTLTIGAMTTHSQVADSADVQHAIPALARLAGGIGDKQVRNRGTLGGSIANADPAADYPAALVGLGAVIKTDRRTIKADDFFTGLYETALKEGELVVSVSFTVPERAGWQKFKQPASRFALVGVFVSKGPAGVRVAVTGAGPSVFRVKALEDKLAATWSALSCEGVKIDASDLNSDLHGSADYRAALIPVLASRAVAGT